MPTSDSHLSVRISPRIRLAVERQAKRDEVSFSDAVRMLLKAYAKGDVVIDVRMADAE